jgi:CheR methyltransferase, SAM binding domain/CheR methyltransferase, all-alpha domain
VSERDPDFEQLLAFIRDERAFDFTGYKRPSLTRRITKRMDARGIDSFAAYQELLEAEPDEFGPLFDTILINVTSFFRDDLAWDYLTAEIVPKIVESSHDIRIWSTGCATGEEAYTTAIVFAEALGEDDFRRCVKIYATDIDGGALSVGRHALLAADRVHELVQPPDRRLRARPAVVPRQDVGERDRQPELQAASHHPPQRGRRVLDRPALRDVVDPALDDESVRARDARREPPLDLLGPLAVDAAVAELEPVPRARRPPLPLAPFV